MKIIKEGKKPTYRTIHAICPGCGAEFEFSRQDCFLVRENNHGITYNICTCPNSYCSEKFVVNQRYWEAPSDEICEPIIKKKELVYEVKHKKKNHIYWRINHV